MNSLKVGSSFVVVALLGACSTHYLDSGPSRDLARAAQSNKAAQFEAVRDENNNLMVKKGPVNLNGFSESFVQWNECSSGGVSAQVTWDYRATQTNAAWPKGKNNFVPCTRRDVSMAFINFLSENFGYCVAMGTLPDAQTAINAALDTVENRELANDVDDAVVKAAQLYLARNSARVDTVYSQISKLEILHQGIIADDAHSIRSLHSAATLRAMDVSHIRLTRKNIRNPVLYQHAVASGADDLELKDRSEHQKAQLSFWRTFGACIAHKGGAVISKPLHHSVSGLRHKGHVHVSLPYAEAGQYFEKDIDFPLQPRP